MSAFDPPLSNEDLTLLMIKHGIICCDDAERSLLGQRISTVGYYRLEEYSWQFRKLNRQDKSRRTAYFKQKMAFTPIWNTYLFDRRLRLLLLDAIERFEIALRNALTQVLTKASGSNTPHTDLSLLPGMKAVDPKRKKSKLQRWMEGIQGKYDDSSHFDPRIDYCKRVHHVSNVEELPLWIVMELTTLGNLKTLYENARCDLQGETANILGVDRDFLTSSIILLHQVRNRCAHHKRVWNYLWLKRTNRLLPLFAHSPQDSVWHLEYNTTESSWQLPQPHGTRMSFCPRDTAFVFILCGFWLDKIAQTSQWKTRVENAVQPHGLLLKNARDAGFCDGWDNHPLWKSVCVVGS